MRYEEVFDMSNFTKCPLLNLPLSESKSQRRIDRAIQTLGDRIVQNLLAFALFLLGADRKSIATHLCMPHGTLLSLLTKIGRCGLSALEDRRHKKSIFLPIKKPQVHETTVEVKTDEIIVKIGNEDCTIKLLAKNSLQVKIVLLTLLSNGFLKSSTVAGILNCTTTHCFRLFRQLISADAQSLLDKRVGQKEDYRIGLEEKAELIQHFTAHIVAGRKVSGESLAKVIKEQTGTVVSPRTVRKHMQKLGLNNIKKTLPELVATLKKN